MIADAYTRAAEGAGYIECRRCHARQTLTADRGARATADIVRAFTAAHEHGSVLVVTPHAGNVRAPVRPRCSRCGATNHNARTCTMPAGASILPECAWCGAVATTVDEDGDPSCEQHRREEARPEVLR